jgi:exodeoxyribonuclease VIII
MNNFMIDLETLSTHSNAAIVSMGVIPFSINKRKIHSTTFYTKVKLESSIAAGSMMDAPTVIWWLKQSKEARDVFLDCEYSMTLPRMLSSLSTLIRDVSSCKEEVKIWGNGAAFDNVILASAYDACKIERPWEFYGDRCYRTLKSLAPSVKMNRIGTYHHALDDALSQTHHLFEIMDSLCL